MPSVTHVPEFERWQYALPEVTVHQPLNPGGGDGEGGGGGQGGGGGGGGDGDGGGGGGDGDGGGGGGMGDGGGGLTLVAQMMNPVRVTELSVYHENVSPVVMATFLGPVPDRYDVPPRVM